MSETKEDLDDEFFGHEYVTIIEPHKSGFDLKLKELWAYRNLIPLFVHRDFVAQCKQTVLGPAWHFVKPLLTTVIFTIVFGNIAKISTDDTAFLLYTKKHNLEKRQRWMESCSTEGLIAWKLTRPLQP